MNGNRTATRATDRGAGMRVAAPEEAVDLFAGGGGGWDLAARALGFDPLGIEWDPSACATREAAGLRTLQADVAQLDPLEFAPVRFLVASAPCQAFSMAGLGAGRDAIKIYAEAIADMAKHGPDALCREELDAACQDERAHLVLEPLRWALALRPEVVACEQVEPVLPLWEAMGQALRRHGYRTWAGSDTGGPDLEKVGGSAAREVIYAEQESGRWEGESEDFGHLTTGGRRRDGRWLVDTGDTRGGQQPDGGRERGMGEPAPVVTGRADQLEWREDAPTHMNTGRDWKPGGDRGDAQRIPTSEPAPTISAKLGGQAHWVDERPATTVAGDPRVFPPGHKVNGEDERAGRGGQQRSGAGPVDADGNATEGQAAVRVSESEAAVLQGFPPDYPWQGTRTARYRQIGDAIPPPLAFAVLNELINDLRTEEVA